LCITGCGQSHLSGLGFIISGERSKLLAPATLFQRVLHASPGAAGAKAQPFNCDSSWPHCSSVAEAKNTRL